MRHGGRAPQGDDGAAPAADEFLDDVTGPVDDEAPRPSARRPLTMLVVGTADWAIEQSAAALEASGHRVLRCHERGEAAFPCNALREGRLCPLEEGFDVVLTVRSRPAPVPTVEEIGVVCALRIGTPLVVAGMAQQSPFEPFTAARVVAGGDVVSACEAAAQRTTSLIDLRPAAGATPDVAPGDAADDAGRGGAERRGGGVAGPAAPVSLPPTCSAGA